ncbi:MAG: PadR family transcriptional regulator [Candidatus Bathyarchaeia archaeon]
MAVIPVPRDVYTRCVKNLKDLLILIALEDSPKCGYDVLSYIHNHFMVLLSPGTVYPSIEALRRDGLIESLPNAEKKLYGLTQRGKEMIKLEFRGYVAVFRRLFSDSASLKEEETWLVR